MPVAGTNVKSVTFDEKVSTRSFEISEEAKSAEEAIEDTLKGLMARGWEKE